MVNNRLKVELITTISRGKTIAKKGLALLRKYILFSTLCATWISYYFYDLFSLSSDSFLISLSILSLPTLIFLIFYYLLSEVNALDEEIKESYGEYSQKKEDYSNKVENQEVIKFFDLIKFGRDFGKIYFALKGESDLIDSFQTIAFLANPLFLIFLVISFASTLFLITLSIITLFVFVI